MHPMNKTGVFLKNFCIMTPGKGTQKYVTSPPQWDGFLYVLNASDPRSLSLDGVENLDKIELKGSSQAKVEKI